MIHASGAAMLRDLDHSALLTAAHSGAARVLRGRPHHLVEEATAGALLGVVQAFRAERSILDPLAYAATAGENAGRDLIRSERRLARLRCALAGVAPPPPGMPNGWEAVELLVHFGDAIHLAEASSGRSPGLRAIAVTLRCLAGGGLPPPPDETARRRLTRGVTRLAALLRAA